MAVKPRRIQHIPTSMPAPIGGLNVRDALNNMPAGDAVALVNWIPQQYGVRCRKGWRRHAIGLVDPVYTVMSYVPDRQVVEETKIFAVTDNDIYDVTARTDAPVSVFTMSGDQDSGYMAYTMFSNIAGTFLVACSHEGGYFVYDGTSWTQPIEGTDPGEINGIDPTELCFVTQWKRRLWFCRKGSDKIYYLATDSITGAITEFDVGPFMKNGGKIAFIANWTIDAGEGIDDLLIVAGENGDILIYKGTNPASAETFALVGVYFIGRLPVGRRGFCSYGGDLLVLSERGIQPMSYVTRGGQSLFRVSSIDYLSKIQPRISDLVAQFSLVKGWSMMIYAKENLLVLTVPIDVTGVYNQYALYTNTNTWTVLQGMPNNGSMGLADSQMFFGTAEGEVIEAFYGFFDNVPYDASENPGDGIFGVIQPAYSYFGKPGMNKTFHMVRPTFLAAVQPAYSVQMAVDFKYVPPLIPEQFPPGGSSLWDIGLWDIATWGGELVTFNEWKSVGAVGFAGAAIINTITVGDTFMPSIDYVFEPGGIL